MNKKEDNNVVKNLNDEDVKGVSGGTAEGKTYAGPTPALDHPIALDYGMPEPRVERPVMVKYGMPEPKINEHSIVFSKYGMPSPKEIDIKKKDME